LIQKCHFNCLLALTVAAATPETEDVAVAPSPGVGLLTSVLAPYESRLIFEFTMGVDEMAWQQV
jgi:hypothetical protein